MLGSWTRSYYFKWHFCTYPDIPVSDWVLSLEMAFVYTHTPAVHSNVRCDEDEATNGTSNYGTNDIFWRTGFLGCVQKNPLSLNVLILTTQNEVFKHCINALCKSVRELIIIALTIICVFITCNHCEIIRWNDIKD